VYCINKCVFKQQSNVSRSARIYAVVRALPATVWVDARFEHGMVLFLCTLRLISTVKWQSSCTRRKRNQPVTTGQAHNNCSQPWSMLRTAQIAHIPRLHYHNPFQRLMTQEPPPLLPPMRESLPAILAPQPLQEPEFALALPLRRLVFVAEETGLQKWEGGG